MPKISVIIPIYNVASYIKQCLDSVVNQTYKDLEIICVDDCGTDASMHIVKDYANKDSRIRIIKHSKNKGLGCARNTGLQKSTGEYIFFLDSDDYLLHNAIQNLYKNITRTGADIAVFSTEAFADKSSGYIENIVKHKNEWLNRLQIDNYKVKFENYSKSIIELNCTAWGKLYKKDFLIKNHLQFIQNNVIHEDNGFWLKICACFPVITYINSVGLMYRIRENSIISSNNVEKKYQHMQKIIEDAFLYIDKYVPYRYKESLKFKIRETQEYAQYVDDCFNNLYLPSLHLTKIKKPKLLIHLHLYYLEQLEYFIDKFDNIVDCIWDLYVTINKKDTETTNKILSFKPDAQILEVSNYGYDILPFIQVLKEVDLNKYDYILKLHTKAYQKENLYNKGIGYAWRNELVDSLIGSKKVFKTNCNILRMHPICGMIGSQKCFSTCTADSIYPEDSYLFEQYCEKLKINNARGHFIGGTMFLCRANIMQIIKNFEIEDSDFTESKYTHDKGTIAHVLERLLCIIVERQGYTINSNNMGFYKSTFIEKIFSVKNSGYHKVVTIFGLKLKFKSKKLLKRYNIDKNSFIEDIFSIKNQIKGSSKHKVITIFGIKVKFKLTHQYHKKNKILLISHELSITGAPLSLLSIAKILQKNYEIELWTLTDGPLKNKFEEINIFPKIVEQNKGLILHRLLKYDLVILNTIITCNIAEICQKYNIPYLWYIREAQNIPVFYNKYDNIPDVINKCSKNICCTSQYAKEYIENAYNVSDIKIIHNFISDEGFTLNDNKTNEITFTFIGTVCDKRKGVDILIQAFTFENAILNICGPCDINCDYCANLLKISNNKHNIIWRNVVTGKEKIKLFKHSNVFVVPSLDESCSRVVLEAMMFGKPVIVTENVGVKYMVTPETGWIVKTGDVESLKNCIENIIKNPEQLDKMGKAARQMYLKTSTEEIYNAELYKLINRYIDTSVFNKFIRYIRYFISWEHIFSAQNQTHGNTKHKVLTILGLKIKFKKRSK